MEWRLEPSRSYASKKEQCSLGRQAPQCNKEAGRERGLGAEKSLMILDGRMESSVEGVTKNKARRSRECVSLSVVEGSLKPYTMTTLSTRPNAPVSTYHEEKHGDASRWLHSHGTKCTPMCLSHCLTCRSGDAVACDAVQRAKNSTCLMMSAPGGHL